MSKYKEALKNLSYDVHRLCEETGWEMDSKDIEVMKELIKENKELKSQLSLTEKALELACGTLRWGHGESEIKKFCQDYIDYYNKTSNLMQETKIIDYFKTKAKEMMKSE